MEDEKEHEWERWQTHSGFRLEVQKCESLLGRSNRKWFILKLILVSGARRALATKQLFTSCSKVHKPCVLSYTAVSIVEDIEKLICEVERRPPLYNQKLKEYSDRNLKDKLWYEFCKSNWPRSKCRKNSVQGHVSRSKCRTKSQCEDW